MISKYEVLDTIKMIDTENLDVRTITMGISLRDCVSADASICCDNIIRKIVDKAKDLVRVGDDIAREFGVPIVNKRISVTPISEIAAASGINDYTVFAKALDKAAADTGVNFIGGFGALVHKGETKSDTVLIDSLPSALAETQRVCAFVNVASTRSGINMDAVAKMGRVIKQTAELTAAGGGIGWAFSKSMNPAVVTGESAFEPRQYHTIKEMKNGQGPAPIKTKEGWLHLAHGVRGCAAGLRYVLYMFMTSLDDPSKVIYTPGGYFMAPEGGERVGDVSNVLFSNGWCATDDGSVFIYYASSDTRLHVATSSIDKLVDYSKNTPPDPLKSHLCVKQRLDLIGGNRAYMES